MSASHAIRYLTAAVVAAVAGFAAVISYGHIYDLARQNGQAELAAVLLPLSVDGLILAASLVLLHEAQQARPAPLLAQGMLGLGVAATLAANALYGLRWGWLGILVSAWPAVAFIGAAEMLFMMVRRSARVVPTEVPASADGPPVAEVAPDREAAARVAYEASVRGGNPLSERQIADRFGLTRPQAKKLRAEVAGTPEMEIATGDAHAREVTSAANGQVHGQAR